MQTLLQTIFGSDWFRYAALPLSTALLVVFVKREARNESLAKEEFAIGVELMVTAIVMHLMATTDVSRQLADVATRMTHSNTASLSQADLDLLHATSAELAGKVFDSVATLFFMLVGLWGTASFVRHWGWESEGKISVVRGIVVPGVLGVLFLYTALVVNA